MFGNHNGEPIQDWEILLGIGLSIVFFLVWGFVWWLVADHIWPWTINKFTNQKEE